MCNNTSMPESVWIPNACFVGKMLVILPATGVETSPSVGTTAKPSPIIFAEKTSSGTSEIGITFPFATEYNSVSFVETGSFSSTTG